MPRNSAGSIPNWPNIRNGIENSPVLSAKCQRKTQGGGTYRSVTCWLDTSAADKCDFHRPDWHHVFPKVPVTSFWLKGYFNWVFPSPENCYPTPVLRTILFDMEFLNIHHFQMDFICMLFIWCSNLAGAGINSILTSYWSWKGTNF